MTQQSINQQKFDASDQRLYTDLGIFGELEHLQDVTVRVREGSNPAAPVLLLRRADKLHAFGLQTPVFLMDVVNAQMGHDAIRVFRRPADPIVPADIESDFAQFEGDEVLVARMQGQLQNVVVETE